MNKLTYPLIAVAIVLLAIVATYTLPLAFGASTGVIPNANDRSETFTFFNATTTTALSTNTANFNDGALFMAGAEKVVMHFQRGDTIGTGNSGTSTFRVQGSFDASTWYDFGLFLSATSSTQTQQTLFGFDGSGVVVNLRGTTTEIRALNLENTAFKYLRCRVTEVADGQHTCKAYAEY